MCSIGGLIASPDFPEELRRKLVLALLPELITRGSDATGIAVFRSPSEVWIKKEPVPSTKFAGKLGRVKGWEKGVIFLLHARAWTSCPPSNNYCNHPLYEVVGDRLVALVHNGIVYDEAELSARKLSVDSDALLNPVRRRKRLDLDTVDEITRIAANMAIIISDGEKVYSYRNENPLCLGVINSGDAIVMASTCQQLRNAVREVGLEPVTSIAMTMPYYIYVYKLGDGVDYDRVRASKPYIYSPYKYSYTRIKLDD